MLVDFFKDEDDFEVQLSTAIHNARTAWEIKFTNNLHNRYLQYGASSLFLKKPAADKIKELQVPYEARKQTK